MFVQPRAVLLLIGTNNVGRVGCSPKHTLAGILHVARYLQQQRPHAQLVLHGLLPRNEEYGDGNFTVGYKWEQLQWINRHLQWFCTHVRKDWHYVEHGDIFMVNDTTINATLMDDALHPTVEGYRLWAPLLVKDIQQILSRQAQR